MADQSNNNEMDEMLRHFETGKEQSGQTEGRPIDLEGFAAELDSVTETEKPDKVSLDDTSIEKDFRQIDLGDIDEMIRKTEPDEPAVTPEKIEIAPEKPAKPVVETAAATAPAETGKKAGDFEIDELSLDDLRRPQKGEKPEKNRKNRNQPTAEDLRKDSVRFWTFTAIVAFLVAAAVLFILYSRGIIGDKKSDTSSETEPSSSSESLTESDTEPTSETEPSSESDTETEPTEPSDESASVLSHYENLFVVSGVGDSPLRVRSAASTDSDILATINEFGGGTILEQTGSWYHIVSGGLEGYVSTQFVKTGTEAQELAVAHATKRVVVTNAENLNVRPEPKKDAEPIVDVVKKGTNMEYLGEEDDFYHIRYGSLFSGYVSKEFTDLDYYLEEAVKYYPES